MKTLEDKYKEILSQVDFSKFEREQDKYSGAYFGDCDRLFRFIPIT